MKRYSSLLSTSGACNDCIRATDAAENENASTHLKTSYMNRPPAPERSSSMPPLAASSFLYSHRFVYDHPFLSPRDRERQRKEREDCFPSLSMSTSAINKTTCRPTLVPSPNTSSSISNVGTARTNTDAECSATANANKIDYRRFLRQHAWALIRNLLTTTVGVEKLREETQVLHQAMWHRAPLDVVKLIVAHNPSCINERDTCQRNGLHIATLCWRGPEIIEYLLSVRRELATDVDHEARTPLHLLLVSYRDIEARYIHKRKKSPHSTPPSSIIQQLVEVAPNTLNEEDRFDMSPIEYAVCCNDLPFNTVQLMRNASQMQWRSKPAHETLQAEHASSSPTFSTTSSISCDNSLHNSIPLASRRRRTTLPRRQGICIIPGAQSGSTCATYDVPTTISIMSDP